MTRRKAAKRSGGARCQTPEEWSGSSISLPATYTCPTGQPVHWQMRPSAANIASGIVRACDVAAETLSISSTNDASRAISD